ncbi:VOC family protein [Sneathiella marina]|uniref:VOC family protein n=1 Tax=Sneathiella marina TaxID=2950108 RepID=A0ABY4W7R4_9PROT|nr:VOC family protein [Sneathiella marina]USG61795.1 VOC family protein [Sneathiella marina]
MLSILKIDHIGIRIREKQRSISFYELLGFKLVIDTGFENGHPIMMEHPSGIVLNLLGPSTSQGEDNILMDISEKHSGYTHMALKISSLPDAESFLNENTIEITGRFSFKDMNAVFIRDPDRNVIELDEYPGDSPASRLSNPQDELPGYEEHP